MKNLLIILSISACLSAKAQENNSAMLNLSPQTMNVNNTSYYSPKVKHADKSNSTSRTTATNSSWFDYFNQIATNSYGYYAWNSYQDTTLFDTVLNDPFTPGPIFFNGFGVSFDPTDSAFNYGYSPAANPFGTAIPFSVTNSNAYEIDSIFLYGRYIRNNNYTDSLILDVVVVNNMPVNSVNNTGTYLVEAPAGYNYSISPDGRPRFANALYDGINNQLANSIATKHRYAMVLDQAASIDTISNGTSRFVFTISPAIQVPAGSKIVTYAHFVSGHTYPVNTYLDGANYFQFFVGDPSIGVFPRQSASNTATHYPGSFQAGLMGDSYAAFQPPFWLANQRMLVPNSQWAGAYGYDAPDWGFYLKCSTCTSLSVASTKNTIIDNKAYPNPANAELNVPFTLGASADVTVTIINTLGQVVASQQIANVTKGAAVFNTSNLTSGIYLYTINANGQQATGRVLIEH